MHKNDLYIRFFCIGKYSLFYKLLSYFYIKKLYSQSKILANTTFIKVSSVVTLILILIFVLDGSSELIRNAHVKESRYF